MRLCCNSDVERHAGTQGTIHPLGTIPTYTAKQVPIPSCNYRGASGYRSIFSMCWARCDRATAA